MSCITLVVVKCFHEDSLKANRVECGSKVDFLLGQARPTCPTSQKPNNQYHTTDPYAVHIELLIRVCVFDISISIRYIP